MIKVFGRAVLSVVLFKVILPRLDQALEIDFDFDEA